MRLLSGVRFETVIAARWLMPGLRSVKQITRESVSKMIFHVLNGYHKPNLMLTQFRG